MGKQKFIPSPASSEGMFSEIHREHLIELWRVEVTIAASPMTASPWMVSLSLLPTLTSSHLSIPVQPDSSSVEVPTGDFLLR